MVSSLFFNLSVKDSVKEVGEIQKDNFISGVESVDNGPIVKNSSPKFKKTIDIYFSAGRNEVDSNGKTVKSCNRNNNWNCGIYKITWDFINEKAVDHKLIYDSPDDGDLSPNLSPNGRFLAFEQRKYNTKQRDIFTINVNPGDHVRDNHIVGSNNTSYINGDSLRPVIKARWPHWRNNEEILFSSDNFEMDDPYKGTDHWGDMYMAPINMRKRNATLDGMDVRLIVGDENSYYQGKYLMSLQDIFVNPANNKMVAGHGKTGEECAPGDDECSGFPFIASFPAEDLKNPTYKRALIEKVKKRSNMVDDFTSGITSCAHLSFSPDGKYVLCTEQHTDDKIVNGVGQTSSKREYVEQDNLYVFQRAYKQGNVSPPSSDDILGRKKMISSVVSYDWEPVGDGPLFRHKSPQKLFELDSNYKTAKYAEGLDKEDLPAGEYCNSKFQHKLAEFCGESYYVVARVACQTNQYGAPEQHLYSRIFLIDFKDKTNPIYHDITGSLESLIGEDSGVFHSQSATCGNYVNTTFAN
tara:strand:+ start:1899 stop:3470 length:1572 start_codon:yes stop_codon:yes gene_type:complete